MNADSANSVYCLKLIIFLIPIARLTLPIIGFTEQHYEHGQGVMQIFDAQAVDNAPQWVMTQIGFLMLNFANGLLFVKNLSEAP